MLQRGARLSISRSRALATTKCIAQMNTSSTEQSPPTSDYHNFVLAQEEYKRGKELFLSMVETFSRPLTKLQKQAVQQAQDRIAAKEVILDGKVIKMLVDSAFRNNTPVVIPRFISTARTLKLRIDTDVYESICDMLVVSRHWKELQYVLKTCYKIGVELSSNILNVQLRLHLHTETYSALQLDEVERFFTLKGCSLNRESFNVLIEAHIANRDLQSCRKVIIRMEDAGYPINEETHRAVLARMASLGPNQALEAQIIGSIGGINPSLEVGVLNKLIRLRSIARDDAAIHEYISYLRDYHQQLTENDDSTNKTLGITPNIETIAVLIEHFARRRNFHGASTVFSLIVPLQLKPSPDVIAQMIFAHGRARQLPTALGFFAALFNGEGPETKNQLHELLYQLGWDGSIPEVDLSDVSANTFILNALLAVTLPIHGLDAAATILEIMRLTFITPDNETSHILLRFLNVTKSMNSGAINKLLYRLSRLHEAGLGIRHINIISHALMREQKKLWKGTGGWSAAAAFLALQRQRIRRQNPPPPTVERVDRHFSIMDGETGIEEADTRILRKNLEAVDRMAKHDHASYSLRMLYHARVTKDAQAVEDIYEEMLENDLRPNSYHIATLIEVYCQTKQLDKAKQILFSATEDSIPVNRVLYTLLIQAYGNEGDPDMGREIYCRMLADRVDPDIASLDVLVRGYFMVKRYIEARETLLEFWHTVLPSSTRPDSTATLGTGLRIMRDMENLTRRRPPTKGQLTGPFVKGLTKNWRRTVKKSNPRSISPALRKLGRAIDAEEVVNRVSLDALQDQS